MKNRVTFVVLALTTSLLVTGCGQRSANPTGPDPISAFSDDGVVQVDTLSLDSSAEKSASVATPLVLSDVVVSAEVIASGDGVSPSEWATISALPKTRALIAKANSYLGLTTTPKPNRGLVTTLRVVYTKAGVTTSMPVRFYIIQLAGTSRNGATAALLVGRYMDSGLWVPRLIIRPNPTNWTVLEFSYRLNNAVTEMAARFGDCLFRSSLKVLEQKNTAAHTALRTKLNQLAQTGVPVSDGLRAVYDARNVGSGVPELAMTTAVVLAGNVEEEYSASYISGTYNQIYKVWPTDSPVVQAAKNLAKQVLNNLLSRAGSYLWTWLSAFFW